MKAYALQNIARHQIIVPTEDDELTIELRWIPATKVWTASLISGNKLTNEVHSIQIVKGVPIFKQYGYPEFFFIALEDEIGEDLSKAVLVTTTVEELKDTAGTLLIRPTGVTVL